MKIKLVILILYLLFNLTHQQRLDDPTTTAVDDDADDDDCAFISGQHCDQNGICKYCAMCLQSSCILSKAINSSNSSSLQQQQQPSSCNTTQFGSTNLYNWYDYCLSSDNDSSGSYCATSTECYQYRKSAGPSVTYAWQNLTCNASTCMLMANNGAPPPIPVPPQTNTSIDNNTTLKKHNSSGDDISIAADRHYYYHANHPFHNPASIALTIVCVLVLAVAFCWLLRFCKKKGIWPFTAATSQRRRKNGSRQLQTTSSVTSSIPSSAPPSFSSTPPDMAMVRHPHLNLYSHRQPSIYSARSSTGSSEPLPCYLSPYPSPPKYEQAIVTQIRGGLREEDSSSTDHHAAPSMWVPVYFTQQQNNFERSVNGGELFGFTPNHSYWLQQMAPNNQHYNHQQENSATTSSNVRSSSSADNNDTSSHATQGFIDINDIDESRR